MADLRDFLVCVDTWKTGCSICCSYYFRGTKKAISWNKQIPQETPISPPDFPPTSQSTATATGMC